MAEWVFVRAPQILRGIFRRSFASATRMQRLIHLGCDFFIELGPGNVLAGLLKRANRDIIVMSVGDAESVRKCGEAL